MAFAIDDDIPAPTSKALKYPFGEMLVGQSCFIAGKGTSAIHSALAPMRRLGRKFSARAVTENGVQGVRVWRIA